jgi:hypothetical protein
VWDFLERSLFSIEKTVSVTSEGLTPYLAYHFQLLLLVLHLAHCMMPLMVWNVRVRHIGMSRFDPPLKFSLLSFPQPLKLRLLFSF